MGARQWSPAEDAVLRRLYGKLPARAIAELLPSRSRGSVATHAFALGIRAGRTGRVRGQFHGGSNLFGCSCRTKTERHWSPSQVNYLEDHYGAMPVGELARCLKRTVSAVRSKASRIGIRSSE